MYIHFPFVLKHLNNGRSSGLPLGPEVLLKTGEYIHLKKPGISQKYFAQIPESDTFLLNLETISEKELIMLRLRIISLLRFSDILFIRWFELGINRIVHIFLTKCIRNIDEEFNPGMFNGACPNLAFGGV
jgi:hypothetical protein